MSLLLAAALCSLPVVQATFILDDIDASRTIESVSMDDTLLPALHQCSNAGYNHSFHHDAGINKGKAHFKFTFDVPQDGCYSIEEYHPGHADTRWQLQYPCEQLLTRNARLDLDFSKGEKSVFIVNQSENGEAWNYLGIRPFYSSNGGTLKISNPGGAEGTYLVADAFRFSRVGDQCTDQLQQQLLNEYMQRHAARIAAEEAATQTSSTTVQIGLLPTSSHHQSLWEVSLHLRIRSYPNIQDDLLDHLRAHTATLEATLQALLQAVQVVVYDIQPVDGRRLGGRRLETSGSPFVVHFRAQVDSIVAVTEAALSEQLNEALGGTSGALQVESAELVDWHQYPTQPEAKERNSENNEASVSLQLGLLITGASVCALGAVLLGSVLFIRFKKKARAKNGDADIVSAHGVVEDVEQGGKVTPKLDDKSDDLEDNASTATPDSAQTPESESPCASSDVRSLA